MNPDVNHDTNKGNPIILSNDSRKKSAIYKMQKTKKRISKFSPLVTWTSGSVSSCLYLVANLGLLTLVKSRLLFDLLDSLVGNLLCLSSVLLSSALGLAGVLTGSSRGLAGVLVGGTLGLTSILVNGSLCLSCKLICRSVLHILCSIGGLLLEVLGLVGSGLRLDTNFLGNLLSNVDSLQENIAGGLGGGISDLLGLVDGLVDDGLWADGGSGEGSVGDNAERSLNAEDGRAEGRHCEGL